jgi:hypothetical protein
MKLKRSASIDVGHFLSCFLLSILKLGPLGLCATENDVIRKAGLRKLITGNRMSADKSSFAATSERGSATL